MGNSPEIRSLPGEVQLAVHAAAVKKLRRKSIFLRFLPELSGLIGVFLGYVVMGEFAPRGVMRPGSSPDPELFGQLILWSMFAPAIGVVLGAWIGMQIHNHFLRREIPKVLEDCLRRIQPAPT